MITLNELHTGVSTLVQRGLDAGLDPAEIADALQAEMDELETTAGPSVKSGPLPVIEPSQERGAAKPSP